MLEPTDSAPVRAKRHHLRDGEYTGTIAVAFTLCVKDRKRPFESARIVEAFRPLMAEALERRSCIAPIYCFMPDHVHILARGSLESSEVRAAINSFKWIAAMWFSKHAPQFQWQKNYYDHILRSSEDWRSQVLYILGNPCRAGLVDDAFAYPHTGSVGLDLRELIKWLD